MNISQLFQYKTIPAVFLAAIFFVPAFALAQSGIVSGSVWVSPSQPEEGQQARIYTAIFNAREQTLSGVAVFRNGEDVLGQREFSVAEGDIVGLSLPWTAEAGKHLFSVSLQDTKLIARDGTSQSIILERGGAQTELALTPSFDEVATKGKETAANVAEGLTQGGQTAAGVIGSAVPESVKEQIAGALATTEEFRKEGTEFLQQKKQEASQPSTTDQSQQTAEEEEEYQIVKTIASALWSVPLAVFEHAALFYLALIALAFFGVRWLWRKVRRRRRRREYDDDDDDEYEYDDEE